MPESHDLQEARHFLQIFEQNSKKPGGFNALAEALLIISDIRENGETDQERKIAGNLFITYAKKAEEYAQVLLADLDSIPNDNLEHWHDVMYEFTDNEMVLPKSFIEKKDELINALLIRIFQKMTPYEKQQFLNKLSGNPLGG